MTITRAQVNLTANWRPVPGYPDYSVSDEGQVISRRRGTPKLLKGSKIAGRYPSVWLCNAAGRRQVGVHRIVASAFLGPGPVGAEVRHRDDNPGNNRLSNLAYGTHADNMRDQVRNGRHAEAAKTHCPEGHPYDEANTLRWADGRRCRACQAARQARRNCQEVAA